MLVFGSSLMVVFSGFRFCEWTAKSGKPTAAINMGKTRRCVAGAEGGSALFGGARSAYRAIGRGVELAVFARQCVDAFEQTLCIRHARKQRGRRAHDFAFGESGTHDREHAEALA